MNREIKQWLLWSHVKQLEHLGSVSFTIPTQNYSQSIIHTGMHTLEHVRLNFILHTNTDTLQQSCTGSMLYCAKRKLSLILKKWISSLKKKTHTYTVAYSNAYTLFFGAQRGLWAFHYWTLSTKELKGISYANALYLVLPLAVSTHTVGICSRTLISLLMDHYSLYFKLEMYIGQDSGWIYGVNQETDRMNVQLYKKLTKVIWYEEH